MSQARLNSSELRFWAETKQPAAKAAATLSPLAVGGLDPSKVTEKNFSLFCFKELFDFILSCYLLPVGESSRPSVIRSLHRPSQVPLGLKAVW